MFYYVHDKWPSVLNVLAKRSGTFFKVHYRLLEMDLDIVSAKLDMKKCIIVLKCSMQYTLHEDWHLLDRVFEQDRLENWIATL